MTESDQPSNQLPAIVPPGLLTVAPDTRLIPALIADAGDAAGWRYVEFFTANIRNPHTRRAYARACGSPTLGVEVSGDRHELARGLEGRASRRAGVSARPWSLSRTGYGTAVFPTRRSSLPRTPDRSVTFSASQSCASMARWELNDSHQLITG
jgi:hypothetical protein